MINKLDNNQIPEGTLNTNRGVLGAAQNVNNGTSSPINVQNSADNTEDASLQISFNNLIEQAAKAPDQDDSAVARAKALIASGQLDTPENIEKAAHNILKYGI